MTPKVRQKRGSNSVFVVTRNTELAYGIGIDPNIVPKMNQKSIQKWIKK